MSDSWSMTNMLAAGMADAILWQDGDCDVESVEIG